MAILTIIILTLIIFIFYKITHVIWKTILATLIILLIIIGATTYFVYSDIQKTITNDKIIIISNENEILTGVIFSNNNTEKKYLDQEMVSNYSGLLKNGDYGGIMGEKYLMAILDISNSMGAKNKSYSNITTSGDEIKQLMLINSPGEFSIKLNSLLGTNNMVLTDMDEIIKYKMNLSSLLLKDMVVKGTLQNNLLIYPERITLKLIGEFPKIFNLIGNKIIQGHLEN